jgi:hypothetical protein
VLFSLAVLSGSHPWSIQSWSIQELSSTHLAGESPWLSHQPADTLYYCELRCLGMPQCQFGTYIAGGKREHQCWLSHESREADLNAACGTPCVSFKRVKRVVGSASEIITLGQTSPPTALPTKLRSSKQVLRIESKQVLHRTRSSGSNSSRSTVAAVVAKSRQLIRIDYHKILTDHAIENKPAGTPGRGGSHRGSDGCNLQAGATFMRTSVTGGVSTTAAARIIGAGGSLVYKLSPSQFGGHNLYLRHKTSDAAARGAAAAVASTDDEYRYLYFSTQYSAWAVGSAIGVAPFTMAIPSNATTPVGCVGDWSLYAYGRPTLSKGLQLACVDAAKP